MSATDSLTLVLTEWTGVFMRRSMRDFTRLMKDNDLSMAQISTLLRLYYGHACGVSDIAGYLGVTNAASSKMIDRLVRQGLLERTEDPTDRRAKRITLSAEGRELVQSIIQARRAWLEELTSLFDPDQQALIATSLTYLTEGARQLEDRLDPEDEPEN